MDTNETRTLLQAEQERLLSARSVLEAEQGISVDGVRVPDASDAQPQDPAEVGDQFADRQEVLDELALLDHDLAEVQAALDRLADGTYGVCSDCGRPIAPERLAALPTSRRCVDDQRAYEAGGGPSVRPGPTSARRNSTGTSATT